MKRSSLLFGLLILFLTMGACGNPSLQSSSQAQISSRQMQSSTADEPQSSSAAPSSANAVSSDGTIQSKAPVSSAGSDTTGDTSPQTQQEALKQVKAALNTKVPLMLPTGLPVEKGCYLAAKTVSQAQNYKVNLYEVKQPEAVNSKAVSKGTLLATVEGTEYQDASVAQDNIPMYRRVDFSGVPSNYQMDLGHNIKAEESAGLGHQWLYWNEGRWFLRLDSPIDPAFKNNKYPDRDQLAKDVVAYLDNYMLPAPQQIGVINIMDWVGNQKQIDNTTAIQFQKGQTVYQITSTDPMVALKVSVAMEIHE